MANNNNNYTAKDIYVLEGLEPVRKRPGMYIGSTGVDGLHHLIWEVVDNSIDEAMAGYAKNIDVSILKDNQVKVSDDGRGIPVEVHKQTKKSALETVMTTLHAGGKFGGESYKISGGLHGVGVSVVNALSQFLKAEICREGELWLQEYTRGVPKAKVKKVGVCRQNGTTVTFEPDPEIFKEIKFSYPRVLDHLRQQAYLTKGVRINIADQRAQPALNYGFYFEGGIVSYVHYLNRAKNKKQDNIFYCDKTVEGIMVEVAFQYTEDFQGSENSFANNIHTPEGGMHLTGFRTALTRTLNDYARKNGFIKNNDDNLTGEDAREGLTVVVSVKLREPQFEGQTKAKLGNPEARSAVESVVAEALADFLEKNPSQGRIILEKTILAKKAREAAKAARDTVIRKGLLDGLALPGKLADCSNREPADSELFIVEGDSAGGCFGGDTKIALADGRDISFKELLEEYRTGKKNYCYTIKNNGLIGLEEIQNVRITRRQARVIKIALDNNEEIVCTPDHKFMLRDGKYKEAQRLQPNDSLMPFSKQYSRLGKRITIQGYEMIFDPLQARWIFTHLLADRYNLERGAYNLTDGSHRHHKDFNKLNNNPENLVRLTKEEHLAYHALLAERTILRPEVREKLKIIHQLPEFREKIRKAMSTPRMRKLLSERAKKQWENTDYKKYMMERFLEFYKSSPQYREKSLARLTEAQQQYWAVKKHRVRQSSRTRRFFADHPERKVWLSQLGEKQWQNAALVDWRSHKTKEQWTSEFRVKRKRMYDQTYLGKAMKTLKEIFDAKGWIDQVNYNQIRKETGDRSLIKIETVCSRFFQGDYKKLEMSVKHYNHKIKRIIPLAELMDVYDLEVPGTHNFALSAGIFVHNSAKQARDRRSQAILPLRGKILNVEKSRLDKMLLNKEIKALVIALGAAIAEEFDIEKMRYHRVVLMTDADVDGAHIRTLLLTLFYRYFPQVIGQGYLYIAQPPLYRLQKGKEIRYVYSDAEKEVVIKEISNLPTSLKLRGASKLKVKIMGEEAGEENISEEDETAAVEKVAGVNIQRYKGLGEMNPQQLWETTMDPAVRVLKQVAIADADAADKIFDILMGSEVGPRKRFIQTHAKTVKNLDI